MANVTGEGDRMTQRNEDALREGIARALAEAEDSASDWSKISNAHFADRFWRGADAVLGLLEGPFFVTDILDGPVAFEQGTLWFRRARNAAESGVRENNPAERED